MRAVRNSIALLVLTLTLAACTTSSLVQPAELFQKGTSTIANKIPGALALANDAQRAALIASYEMDLIERVEGRASSSRVDPFEKPIIDPNAIHQRELAFKALAAYAESVTNLVGDDATIELDESTQTLGKALLSMSSKWAALGGEQQVTSEQVAIGTTAMHALGRLIVEARVREDLPPFVDEADLAISKLAEVAESDCEYAYGVVDKTLKHRVAEMDSAIQRALPNLSPSDRRAEIALLVEAVEAREVALSTITAASAAVKQMKAAHSRLRTAVHRDGSSVDMDALVDFVAEARKLKEFYESSKSKLQTN